jgi:HD-GYP domain-containing protein (c-di-GMP phosphodiesterase class II)
VLAHHEHWDGSGYPKGLSGQEIPWVARVIAVADAYETMTAEKPYRKAVSSEEAARDLIRCIGAQFDSDITSVFVTKVLGLPME